MFIKKHVVGLGVATGHIQVGPYKIHLHINY